MRFLLTGRSVAFSRFFSIPFPSAPSALGAHEIPFSLPVGPWFVWFPWVSYPSWIPSFRFFPSSSNFPRLGFPGSHTSPASHVPLGSPNFLGPHGSPSSLGSPVHMRSSMPIAFRGTYSEEAFEWSVTRLLPISFCPSSLLGPCSFPGPFPGPCAC